MSDELWKFAPGIAGILFVVVTFLKYMRDENKRREKTEAQRIDSFKHMGETCHEHTKTLNDRCCVVIEEATAVTKKNIEALGSIAELMRGCADRVNGKIKK